MTRARTIADRIADRLLLLIGSLHLFFMALFYFALLFAAAQAHAEEAGSCRGENMLAAMERDNPAQLKAIREEAARVENGGALLWRIGKEGVEPLISSAPCIFPTRE